MRVDKIERLIAEVGQAVSDKVRLAFDGSWPTMFARAAKNYALRAADGHVTVKGASLRSSKDSPAIATARETMLRFLLEGRVDDLHSTYVKLREDVASRRLPVSELAQTARLSQSLEEYQAALTGNSARNPQPWMAAWERYHGQEMLRVGDNVEYYVAEKKKASAPDYETATLLSEAPATPDYDVRTYLKKVDGLKDVFRHAFSNADLEKLFDIDPAVLVGGIKPQARRLRAFGTDDPWSEISFGAKSRAKPIRNRFFCDSDTTERDELIEKHGDGDLHQSALGAYGERPRKVADMGCRVRTGDFYCECECKTVTEPKAGEAQPLRELSLLTAKATVELLTTELGLVPDHDLRPYYNGNHDIVIRIRQSAFGIPDIIGLERHWERFARHLEERLRQDPAVAAAIRAAGADPDKVTVLDLNMYLPTSLLRVANTPHHATGRYFVPVSIDELNAARAIADLHPLAQAPRDEVPFDATDVVGPLRQLLETITHDLPRQETFDPWARARSESAKKRSARRAKKAQRRARRSGKTVTVPCFDRIKEEIEAGNSIAYIPCAKFACEARFALGMSNNDVAEILVSGAGGTDRYVSGGRVEPDPRPEDERNACGYRIPEHIWPEDESQHQRVGCRRLEVAHFCAETRCYRAAEMFSFDEAGSPTFAQFCQEGRSKLAAFVDEDRPQPGITFAQATTRSGKTWQITRKCAEHANAGQRSWIAVPNHAVGKTIESYVSQQGVLHPDKLILHVYGKQEQTCVKESKKTSCSGCAHGLTLSTGQKDATGAPQRKPNPNVTALRGESHVGVYGFSRLRALAEKHNLCARTVGWALVPGADVLIIPHAYLCQDVARRILPAPPDHIFVDEADQLPDGLQGESIERLRLSFVRTAAARSLRDGCCEDRCEKCHIDFVCRYRGDAGRYDVDSQLGAVDEGSDPARLVGLLRRGLGLLQRFDGAALTVQGALDLAKLTDNVELLAEVLSPPKIMALGADHLPPKDYFQALGKHLTSPDFISAHPSVRPLPGIDLEEVMAVVLMFGRCLGTAGDDEDDDEAPRDEFRLEFGRIDLKLFFREEFFAQDKLKALTDDETEALMGVLRFAIYTNNAARDSSGAVLVGAWRPWEGADFIPSCRLELQYCNAARFAHVRKLLSASRTTLVSGTHIDKEQAAHALLLHDALIEYRSLDVPMHQRLTLIQHCVDPGPSGQRGQHLSLKTLFAGFLHTLIEKAHELALPLKGQHWPRILVFTKSTKAGYEALVEAGKMPKSVRVEHRAGTRGFVHIREEHGIEHGGDRECNALVAIDYLRSPGSRGVDRDYDVIVGYGDGYPEFTGFFAYLSEVNQISGAKYDVQDLANYNRSRSLWQSMMRSAGDGSRPRVIVTISDAGVGDVPTFLLNRRLSAAEYYRGIQVEEEDKLSDIAFKQAQTLGAAVASLLQGIAPDIGGKAPEECPPTGDDSEDAFYERMEDAVLHWDGRSDPRVEKANGERLDHLDDVHQKGTFYTKSEQVGKRQSWVQFLNWLHANKLLTRRLVQHDQEGLEGGRSAEVFYATETIVQLWHFRWARQLRAEGKRVPPRPPRGGRGHVVGVISHGTGPVRLTPWKGWPEGNLGEAMRRTTPEQKAA